MKSFDAQVNPKFLHSEITATILKGFYAVCNEIGFGFGLEVTKHALVVEWESLGLKCELDKVLTISHKEVEIGSFTIDILVNDTINILLISEPLILREHEVRLSNQLKLSQIEVGLILNAYIEGEHKRIVYTNNIKKRS